MKNNRMISKQHREILEEAFKEEILAYRTKRVKVTSFIAMIAIPAFSILDYFMYPDYLFSLISIRIAITIPFVLVYLTISKVDLLRKYILGLSMFLFLVAGFGIALMIHLTEGYESPYYAGLVVVILVLCITLTLPVKNTIIISFLIYASYIIPVLAMGNIDNIPIFINNNFFLLAMIVFALFGAYTQEFIQLHEYKSRYEMQEANEELQQLTDELEETNEKLLVHDRLKTQFFANVSHELRTPLTLILAPLAPLIEDRESILPDSVKETMKVMQHNGFRLLKQINNLLDLTRLEEGKMRLNFQEVDFISFCKEIVASVQPLAASRGLKLYFQYQMEEELRVVIDCEQFEKVVLNLLHNAIKFTGEGGRITLFLDDREDYVELAVQDTGEGIPSDMLEIIFDRFAQVDGSSTRMREGSGLGLSLVKEIVELHGGLIQARSELGKGSRFVVHIRKGECHIHDDLRDRRKEERPVMYKKRASDIEELKVMDVVRNYGELQLIDLEHRIDLMENGNQSGRHDHTIMVIDDNRDILKLMHFLLGDEFNLILSLSAQEGLKIISERSPDLVLCDVMMPGIDGYTFCKTVKADDSLKHIPIILVTARAGSDMLVEGIDSGADDYLAKPFDLAELKARIRSLLRTRRVEAELALANYNLKARADDLVNRQRSLLHSMIKSLVSTIEAKDNYTRDHSLRVSRYSIAIARQMGFSEQEVRDLELASLLHDVGKIAVPEGILHKKENLTDKEYFHIQNHPVHGELIIKPISELKHVANMVIAHHEHYNGNGYPHSLYKDDIPLGARVMAIADAYDAMTSERPYRVAISHNNAVKEIVRCSGNQFDPAVVEVFLQLADEFSEIKKSCSVAGG